MTWFSAHVSHCGAERKLDEMEGAMHVIDSEIGVLEEQQADLLRQLAIVQQQIGAAKAKRVGFVATLVVRAF